MYRSICRLRSKRSADPTATSGPSAKIALQLTLRWGGGTKATCPLSILSDASRSDLRRVFSIQDHRLRRSRLPQRALEAIGILASLFGPGRCIAVPMMFHSLVQD